MSEALGRRNEPAQPPFDEWADAAKASRGPRREGLRRMYAHFDQFGFPGGNALVLRAILGREPRTLGQYVQVHATRQAGS